MRTLIHRRLALLAALFGSYFGSLWLASLYFPRPYDWRRNVISNLLSPRDNPGWYWLPSLGLAVAGLCMLPLAAWIERELGDRDTPLARYLRRPAFLAGIACLILSALVVPGHSHPFLGLRHAHELLARASAAGLGVGMLSACGSPGLEFGTAQTRNRLRALRAIWCGVTWIPLLGAAGSGILVALAHFHALPLAAAEFFRGTVFWHLAFWEWAGSAAVFLFFATPVLILGRRRPPPAIPR